MFNSANAHTITRNDAMLDATTTADDYSDHSHDDLYEDGDIGPNLEAAMNADLLRHFGSNTSF